ncbi:MAG: type II toxin-antitoxin system RelE/ParE family toxin [Bacteroidota bacterium]
MEINFDSKKLAKQFADAKAIKREFGDMAKGIIARLADLEAVEILADMRTLPAAQCHELTGAYLGYFAVKISPNYRLIFYPTQQPPPKLKDGGIDWSAIDAITITEITDYH